MPIVPLTEDEMSDEEKKSLPKIQSYYPCEMVLFPNVVIPITVSRKNQLRPYRKPKKPGNILVSFLKPMPKSENPTFDEINKMGTVAQIIRQIKMPDDSITVFMRGRLRFRK